MVRLKIKKNTYRTKYNNEEGSVVLEFAYAFIPFIMSIFFVLEICRITYVTSSLDFVISESGYSASVTQQPGNYEKLFATRLKEKLSGIPLLGRGIVLQSSIIYCKDISALADVLHNCSPQNAAGNQLAIYEVKINYQSIFFDFISPIFNKSLSRKMIFVQEFERTTI